MESENVFGFADRLIKIKFYLIEWSFVRRREGWNDKLSNIKMVLLSIAKLCWNDGRKGKICDRRK